MHGNNISVETLLGHIPMFNGLTQEELGRVARGTREIHASKGEILFHKGDPCLGFHLLVFGQVKLGLTSSQGNEKVVEIINPGASFGEALMFMEKPYIVFAQTLSDSLLLHISKNTIFEELEREPRLCRKMIAGMAMRLHSLMGDLESYSLHSGTKRVIDYLLQNSGKQPGDNSAVSVTLPTSKGIIASRLNLTQEHFSRILHELTHSDLITVEGRKIHIPSPDKLRQYKG